MLASTSVTVRSIIPFGSDGNTNMLERRRRCPRHRHLAARTRGVSLPVRHRLRSGTQRSELESDWGNSSRAGSPGTQRDSRARSSCCLRTVPSPLSGRARRLARLQLEVICPSSIRRDLQGRTTRFRSPVVSCFQPPRGQWVKRFVAATGRGRCSQRAGGSFGRRLSRGRRGFEG